MKRSPIARIAGVVAARHGVVLSLALAPRRIGMAMGPALALGVRRSTA